MGMPSDADYDARRGSARARGYTAAWDRASLAFRRERPLCLGCEAVGLVVVCEVVDHVIPHKGDEVLFWDRARWQPSCRWHHDVVKQILEQLYAHGTATEADLWLNSAKAIAITNRERTSIGDDGWPTTS
jgi:5-methylcytosine-specific restriction protein A